MRLRMLTTCLCRCVLQPSSPCPPRQVQLAMRRNILEINLTFDLAQQAEGAIRCNLAGNHRKSIPFSVESSLKRLQTKYCTLNHAW